MIMHGRYMEFYLSDISRYSKEDLTLYIKFFHLFHRKAMFATNRILGMIYRAIFKFIRDRRGIELGFNCQVGKGLRLGHAYNITINNDSIIGKNVNLHKGVTIGQENRGSRKGAPVIGNTVWIGINAAIVGHVTIGDDVLIAPNSFVNCDIPSHSVVMGNPCQFFPRNNATEGYMNKLYVEEDTR